MDEPQSPLAAAGVALTRLGPGVGSGSSGALQPAMTDAAVVGTRAAAVVAPSSRGHKSNSQIPQYTSYKKCCCTVRAGGPHPRPPPGGGTTSLDFDTETVSCGLAVEGFFLQPFLIQANFIPLILNL